MRIREDLDRVRITRRVKLEDGPVVADVHSTNGRRFQVNNVTVEYQLKENLWVVTSDYQVSLFGKAVKKDGTPGAAVVQRNAPYGWIRDRDSLPWLHEIVDRIRPTGVPSLPAGDFEIEGA